MSCVLSTGQVMKHHKVMHSHNTGNVLIWLPVIHLVMDFLSDPISLEAFASASTEALHVVKNVIKSSNTSLSYTWKEIEWSPWGTYVSGMRGNGSMWSPYRVDWITLARHLSPSISITLDLKWLMDHLDVCISADNAIAINGGPWIHNVVKFKLSSDKPHDMLHQFKAVTYLMPHQHPSWIMPEEMVVKCPTESRTQWWVGHCVYGASRRLVFGETTQNHTIRLLPGDIETAKCHAMQWLHLSRDSDFTEIRRQQAENNFDYVKGIDALKGLQFQHSSLTVELYELIQK